MIGTVLVIVVFVVTGSRQLPNQPHFTHVVVVAVIVSVVNDVVSLVVVLSSYTSSQPNDIQLEHAKEGFTRQPHQPGVWHVVVRVRLVLEELLVLDFVASEPLLL